MPSIEEGGTTCRKLARNCSPCSRCCCHCPLAWMLSPACTSAAEPSTVTRSRWPRTLTRSTQKPVSALWNVTRSTSPDKGSRLRSWSGTALAMEHTRSASAALKQAILLDAIAASSAALRSNRRLRVQRQAGLRSCIRSNSNCIVGPALRHAFDVVGCFLRLLPCSPCRCHFLDGPDGIRSLLAEAFGV